jgi:hypothetical protein
MTRVLIVLVGLAILSAALAAPVPEHLFPKGPPLYYPTQKGARWVYLEGDGEHSDVVTGAGRNEDGDAVVVTIAEEKDGKQTPVPRHNLVRPGHRGRQGEVRQQDGGSEVVRPG